MKKKKTKRDPGTFGYKLLTPFMRVLFRLYYNPKIINKQNIPKDGALVICCNHIHVYDQCLTIMATKRPINYMSKKEYFEGKLKGLFKFVGCIPVNRNGRDTASTMAAITVLRRNGAIGIFPEGTRNKTDAWLLPFKPGAAAIAQKTGAKLLPVAVTGDYVFRSKNLTVSFGEAFSTEGMTIEEATKKLQDEVSKLKQDNLCIDNIEQQVAC